MNGNDLTSNLWVFLPRSLGTLLIGIVIIVAITGMAVLRYLMEHSPAAPVPPPPPIERIVEFKVGSCQYLALKNTSGAYTITHKGDCTNEFHKTHAR